MCNKLLHMDTAPLNAGRFTPVCLQLAVNVGRVSKWDVKGPLKTTSVPTVTLSASIETFLCWHRAARGKCYEKRCLYELDVIRPQHCNCNIYTLIVAECWIWTRILIESSAAHRDDYNYYDSLIVSWIYSGDYPGAARWQHCRLLKCFPVNEAAKQEDCCIPSCSFSLFTVVRE